MEHTLAPKSGPDQKNEVGREGLGMPQRRQGKNKDAERVGSSRHEA